MNGERDIWHFDILDDVDDEKIHVAKKISSKIESLGLSKYIMQQFRIFNYFLCKEIMLYS